MNERDVLDTMLTESYASYVARGVPAHTTVWPRIQARLSEAMKPVAHEPSRRARLPQLVLRSALILLVVVAGIAASAVASAQVRAGLHRVVQDAAASVGVSFSPETGKFGVSPATKFAVLQPRYLPASLTFSEASNIPAPVPGRKLGQWIPTLSKYPPCSPTSGGKQPCPGAELATHFPASWQKLVDENVDAVWFYYAALPPQNGYVGISEHATILGRSLVPGGTRVVVSGQDFLITHEGMVTTIGFTFRGTDVVIDTNLSQSEGMRVAESMIGQ